MTSGLTPEQTLFEDTLVKAIGKVSPLERVQLLDAQKTFDHELYKTLATMGVWGIGVDEAYGGCGSGNMEQMIALRTLGSMATSMAVFCVVQYLITRLLKDNGNEAQKQRYLKPLAGGEVKASFCLTESGGGTDILRAMKTRATPRPGGGYTLNGTKMWISGATTSDFYIVLARTSDGKTDGVSMFVLPANTPGVSAREVQTFAINGYDTCQVYFDDVVIPSENLIGVEGKGFRQVLATLNSERINASAVALGITHGAMTYAAQYARERSAFNKTLSELQAVQHKLANVATSYELAWTHLLDTARRDDAGEPVDVASSMAKMASSTVGKAATDIGMEIMGGAGFDMASPMQRYFRDQRLYSFAPLNDEMCRNLIAERYFDFKRAF